MRDAYYNEIDPKAAATLRELIKRGAIAPGDVDERSIEDIAPDDLRGYAQCHFFAGIGVWSYALRLAGWGDERPVWTGSCPCQPYSQAGKGAGFADERHLWPHWHHLVRECRPAVVFGEQVASKAADSWADLVQDDLEALGYAFGAVPFPAASVGAPHIRDRLYWVAESDVAERRPDAARGHERHGADAGRAQGAGHAQGRGGNGRLADDDAGREQHAQRDGEPQRGLEEGTRGDDVGGRGELRIVGHHHHSRLEGRSLPAGGRAGECTPWSASDFVWCRDGKWRPVEPGTFPLVNGAPARVGRLRGYGNAIVSEAAKAFIQATGLV